MKKENLSNTPVGETNPNYPKIMYKSKFNYEKDFTKKKSCF